MDYLKTHVHYLSEDIQNPTDWIAVSRVGEVRMDFLTYYAPDGELHIYKIPDGGKVTIFCNPDDKRWFWVNFDIGPIVRFVSFLLMPIGDYNGFQGVKPSNPPYGLQLPTKPKMRPDPKPKPKQKPTPPRLTGGSSANCPPPGFTNLGLGENPYPNR